MASEASRAVTLLVKGGQGGGPRELLDVVLLWLLSCHLSHRCGHYGNEIQGHTRDGCTLAKHTVPQ